MPQSKALIAIAGCERDARNGYNQAIRDTWKKAVSGADFLFFVGQGDIPLASDEIRIAAPDDYKSLPYKTKAILNWSIEHGYDHTFKCDTDTFVYPSRLLASGFENYDYSGWFNGVPNQRCVTDRQWYTWASGGIGYWLSRKAAQIVVAQEPHHWAEDLWVGQVLSHKPISIFHDPRYWTEDINTQISIHLGFGKQAEGAKRSYSTQQMYEKYQKAVAIGAMK
jgi:hypothetical protein